MWCFVTHFPLQTHTHHIKLNALPLTRLLQTHTHTHIQSLTHPLLRVVCVCVRAVHQQEEQRRRIIPPLPSSSESGVIKLPPQRHPFRQTILAFSHRHRRQSRTSPTSRRSSHRLSIMASKQLMNGGGGGGGGGGGPSSGGSSSTTTTTVNNAGHKISIDATANGVNRHPQSLVAVPEMCSYCFEVLDNELESLERQLTRPSFSNDS